MNKTLNILLLEDVPTDAKLIEHELLKGAFPFILKRVTTEETFRKALKEFKPDIILADYKLPSFDGISALRIVEKDYPEIPFIFVSGYRGEELAVETLKSGATDFIVKDNLSRLVPSVRLALKEHEERIKRMQAEEELRKSEERLRAILDNTPTFVFIKDTLGRYTFINRQCEKLLHVNSDDAKNKTDYDLLPKVVADTLSANDRKVIETVRPIEFEEALPHDDGVHTFIVVKFPLCESTGAVYAICGIAMDITERKRAEEEKEKLREHLYHAQKIESVGTLAGGIAHDFNNILTSIIGYGNLLSMEMKEGSQSRDFVQKILKSAEKAAGLTRGLLTFSRKQPANPKQINLNEVVKEIECLLSRVIREDIKFKTVLTEETCVVMADSGQIEQVLMNLVTNARDAMPKGGSLVINMDTVKIDNDFIRTHSYGTIGTYALISVSDTGIGMDEKTREKIFEPFFTTKEVGKGTGLGLAIVYGIVKQHNGYINVYSEKGTGTTFRIYLPLIRSGFEKAKEEIHTIPKGGTETILVAEDDEDVRKLTKMALEGHGYTVIEAIDGRDAIDKFMENKDRIQLLILDVIMPKKNGKEVYDEIKKTKSGMKSLFVSGYSKDIIQEKDIFEEGLTFISKPVSPIELLRTIRQTLDK